MSYFTILWLFWDIRIESNVYFALFISENRILDRSTVLSILTITTSFLNQIQQAFLHRYQRKMFYRVSWKEKCPEHFDFLIVYAIKLRSEQITNYFVPHVNTSPCRVNTTVCWFPQVAAATWSGSKTSIGSANRSDIEHPNCLSTLFPNKNKRPQSLTNAVW
jgi:hypothetical protein